MQINESRNVGRNGAHNDLKYRRDWQVVEEKEGEITTEKNRGSNAGMVHREEAVEI